MNKLAILTFSALLPLASCGTSSSGATTPPTPLPDVQQSRYEADLRLIAKARPPGSAHWQVVQDLCKTRLTQLGFTVTLHKYSTGVNVIGKLPGTREPEREVFVSAHYDHIKGCVGADDNASGLAGVLEAARVLSTRRHPRTLVAACWDEEEAGLVGSLAYAAEAAKRGDKILTNFVFEMIGYRSTAANSQQIPTGFEGVFPDEVAEIKAGGNRGDFIAVIYNKDNPCLASGGICDSLNAAAAQQMVARAKKTGLKLYPLALTNNIAPLLAAVMRSDHASFWLKGYPAFMITDSANYRNPNYHCSKGKSDSVDTLDHAFAAQVIQSTVDGALSVLEGK